MGINKFNKRYEINVYRGRSGRVSVPIWGSINLTIKQAMRLAMAIIGFRPLVGINKFNTI